MPIFRVRDLPELTKSIHQGQTRWRDKNWKKTLSTHGPELEDLLKKINVFSKWTNKLQQSDAAKKLFPEIFTDALFSVHFACFGLYKYANICLRSELETTLRLIFFSTHPVEFNWWLEGKYVFRNIYSQANDVWGPEYVYFKNLDNVRKFEIGCEKSMRLFSEGSKLKKMYGTLSHFIHSGAGHFQSGRGRFIPSYKLDEFKQWCLRCNEAQTYINVLLALTFSEEFKGMTPTSRTAILNVGIGNEYKEIVKQTLGL